jgi:hypothetical protein
MGRGRSEGRPSGWSSWGWCRSLQGGACGSSDWSIARGPTRAVHLLAKPAGWAPAFGDARCRYSCRSRSLRWEHQSGVIFALGLPWSGPLRQLSRPAPLACQEPANHDRHGPRTHSRPSLFVAGAVKRPISLAGIHG